MGVLLQAFYWDCPREAGVEFGWWQHVNLGELDQCGAVPTWFGTRAELASAG